MSSSLGVLKPGKSWPFYVTLFCTLVLWAAAFGIYGDTLDFQLYDTYFVMSSISFGLIMAIIISLILVTIYQVIHKFKPLVSAIFILAVVAFSIIRIAQVSKSLEFFVSGSEEPYVSDNPIFQYLDYALIPLFVLLMINLFIVVKRVFLRKRI
ncbi:hypothetical protein [Roseivirga echinicomitans]|uniref:Uncharacterized protein n=1 Tax=Roseivirga echinicomitans TaxID=296218 RepID=A0A150XJA0_9BACT|nr:hypothetical protein [Roseivirga echinicomitans]KYG78742.1 hypothetical protein AWN68_03680 [Roseivirga echinicomitans]